MKTPLLLALAALAIAASGCHIITIPTPSGNAVVRSFGQRVTIGGLSWTPNGALTVSNYNLDQVSGIQAVGQIAIQAAQIGAFAAMHGTNALPATNAPATPR